MHWSSWGGGGGVGDRGAGAREKEHGRRDRKEREAGVIRGWEAGGNIDKTLKKIY